MIKEDWYEEIANDAYHLVVDELARGDVRYLAESYVEGWTDEELINEAYLGYDNKYDIAWWILDVEQ